MSVLFALAACGVTPVKTKEPVVPKEPVAPAERALTTWTVDPTFQAAEIDDPETRAWYERVKLEIAEERATVCLSEEAAPEDYPVYPKSATVAACSGVKHYVGRALNYYVTELLTLFRVTGDSDLLEEVDRVMEVARSRLRDTDSDGYNNWRWLSWIDKKDFNLKEDSLSHGFIAEVAYVLGRNAPFSTQAHDYAAHADAWRGYIREDFEGKWAAQPARRTTGGLPVSHIFHPYIDLLRYVVYMSKLFPEDSRYERLRLEMSKTALSQFKTDKTAAGDAFVWSHFVRHLAPDAGPDTCLSFQMGVYPVQVMQVVMDLALEGQTGFASDAAMQTFSRSLSVSILERTEYGMTYKDVGGLRHGTLDPKVRKKTWLDGWCFEEAPDDGALDSYFRNEKSYRVLPWAFLVTWAASDTADMEATEIYGVNRRVYGDPYRESTPTAHLSVPAGMAFARLYRAGGYTLGD